MLTVQRSTTINVPLETAFEYFADFANTAQWDPGVVSSEKLTPGPLRVGDRYAIVATFAGRKLPMKYEVNALDAPHRIVLQGESSTSTVQDVIEFSPKAGRTEVTWTLHVKLHGIASLTEPAMRPLVDRLARKAIEGMEEASWNGVPHRARLQS